MKFKYKIYYIFLAALVIGTFIGLYKAFEIKDIDILKVKTTITESTDVSLMDEDDGTKLRKLYNINKYDLDEFIYYAPKSNMEANEILVIKPKNPSDFENIKSTANNRIKTQSDSFRNYNLEQYEILSNYVLEEKNDYIIIVISKDSEKIMKSLNNIF